MLTTKTEVLEIFYDTVCSTPDGDRIHSETWRRSSKEKELWGKIIKIVNSAQYDVRFNHYVHHYITDEFEVNKIQNSDYVIYGKFTVFLNVVME